MSNTAMAPRTDILVNLLLLPLLLLLLLLLLLPLLLLPLLLPLQFGHQAQSASTMHD